MPVVLDLASPADLPTVAARIFALEQDPDGPAAVEARLGAGPFDASTMTLGDARAPRPLALRVTGGGATLERARLVVNGRDVTVSGITFADVREGTALTIEATASVRLEDVTVRGVANPGGGGSRSAAGGIRLLAKGPGVAVSAERVRLVDIAATALALTGKPGGSFGDVSWADGRIGGCAAPEIRLGPVARFTAPGTLRAGTGEALAEASPATLVDAAPDDVDDPSAALAAWRRGDW